MNAHALASSATRPQLIDWARFHLVRDYADRRIVRLISYFREDAETCLAAADKAARAGNLRAMIGQLEALRRDAMQLGALGLAELAESIEHEARDILDHGMTDFALPPGLPALSRALQDTLGALEAEISAPPAALQTSR
jgi:hypothetical protein